MRPNPCWQLYQDIEFRGKEKKDIITYYLQEFYTGKKKKVSGYLGKKLWKLGKERRKAHNKVCNLEFKITKIIKKIVKTKKGE